MKTNFRYFIFGLMALGLLFVSTTIAGAALIPITSVDGDWASPIGGQNVVILNDQAPDGRLATASWGEPTWLTSPARSSYSFTSRATPFNANSDGTLIDLGEFTHNNFPIPSGSGITSIGLAFNFGIDSIAPLVATFNFSHDETPNDGSPMHNRDIVTITNAPINTEFWYDSDGNGTAERYYASLLGFSQGATPNPSLTFYTYENTANTANLYATITEVPIPNVPIPAAIWLLGSGLIGLVGLRRRFRK